MSIKKDNELWIIQIFEDYSHLQISKNLIQTESPDFISELSGKQIGIEITEIYQDSDQGSSILKQQSSYKKVFTEVLMSELKKHLSYNFGIDVDIDFRIPMKKSDFNSIAKSIRITCYPYLKDLAGNYSSEEFENYNYNLPEAIKSIRVTRIDDLDEPHNFQSEGGVVPVLTNEHLYDVICKKELALLKFQKCDEYWLIIREGNYHSGSFARDTNLILPFASKFDRIYLLRTSRNELILLT